MPFPRLIIIAVIVLPHHGRFRRGPLMQNTCSNWSSWPWSGWALSFTWSSFANEKALKGANVVR